MYIFFSNMQLFKKMLKNLMFSIMIIIRIVHNYDNN